MTRDIFRYHVGVGVADYCFQWIKVGDTAKLPTMHRTAPITKNHPAQHVSSAKIEKPWLKALISSFSLHQNHSEGFLRHRLLVWKPWSRALEFAFLTNSRVILMPLLGPTFENQLSRASLP